MSTLYISKSPLVKSLHNRGVFANRNFEKSDIIEVCPVIPISEKDFKKLKGTALENYPFSWNDDSTCIVLGYGSLYNHSDTPNIKWFDTDLVKVFYALRDIKKDEELLYNYNNPEYQF